MILCDRNTCVKKMGFLSKKTLKTKAEKSQKNSFLRIFPTFVVLFFIFDGIFIQNIKFFGEKFATFFENLLLFSKKIKKKF